MFLPILFSMLLNPVRTSESASFALALALAMLDDGIFHSSISDFIVMVLKWNISFLPQSISKLNRDWKYRIAR